MTLSQQQRIDWLLQGPLALVLAKLSLPMAGGLFALFCLDFIEALFIAELGESELAAISFTYPISNAMLAIAFGVSIAFSSQISLVVGKKDFQQLRCLIFDGLLIGGLVGVIFALVGFFTMDLVTVFLGANKTPEVYALVKPYLMLKYSGLPFLVLGLFISATLRSLGNTTGASSIIILGACTNLVCAPFLIFGIDGYLGLGISGAAIAQIIGNLCMSSYGIFLLAKKEKIFAYTSPIFVLYRINLITRWKRSFKLLPCTIGIQILTPLVLAILTMMVAKHGQESLSAFGFLLRAEPLLLFVPLVLTTSLPVFAGQNWGAGEVNRAKSAIWLSLSTCIFIQVFCYLLVLINIDSISQMLCDNQIIQSWVHFSFLCVVFSYTGLSVAILGVSIAKSIGKFSLAIEFSVVRYLIILLPLVIVFDHYFTFRGVLWGISFANLLIGVYVISRLLKVFRLSEIQSK